MGNYIKSKYADFQAPRDARKQQDYSEAYKEFQPHSLRELMWIKVDKDPDGAWIKYCQKGTAVIGTLSGMLVYSTFRQVLTLYEGFMIGHTIIGAASGFFSYGLRKHFYQESILTGQLNCLPCALTGGSVFQLITASAVPFGLSFGFSAVMATRYNYINIPSFRVLINPSKEFKEFWYPKFRVISRKMAPLMILQIGFGSFFAYKELRTSETLRKKLTEKEVKHLWGKTLGIFSF